MTSPWSVPIFINLTVPSSAGPGNARIVIASQLPPPLDTYVFYGDQTYAGALIFYAQGSDLDYTYLGVVEDVADQDISIHVGHVLNGAVVEISVGVPAVQRWLIEQSTGQQTFEIYSHDFTNILSLNTVTVRAGGPGGLNLLATGVGGDIAGSAIDGISFDGGGAVALTRNGGTQGFKADAGGVSMIAPGALQNASVASTAATTITGQQQVRLFGPANDQIVISNTGIALTATNAGNDITLQAADVISLTAGTEVTVPSDLNVTSAKSYELDGIPIYNITDVQFASCSALLNLPLAITAIPGMSVNVTALRNNATLDISAVYDMHQIAVSASTSVLYFYVDGVQVAAPQAPWSGQTNGIRLPTAHQDLIGGITAGVHTVECRGQNLTAAGVHRVNAQHSTLKVKVLEV